MNRGMLLCLTFLVLSGPRTGAADEEVFSGPQVGERLAPFTMQGVLGDEADRELEIISPADGGPVVIIFFHQLTRPAFGLTNTVTRMAASRKQDGLKTAVCFLTDNPTATADRMKQISRYFSKDVVHGMSLDGPEGPGAYGLNRHVTLTVLVGKDNRVTANFALVQPSEQADGPQIFKAIVDVLGGGKVPKLGQFSRRGRDVAMRLNPRLQDLLRTLRKRDASTEEVQKAVAAVEAAVEKKARLKAQLGGWAARIVRSQRLAEIAPTEPAQAAIRQWAKKFGRMSPQRP